jgi:hypothetical protein
VAALGSTLPGIESGSLFSGGEEVPSPAVCAGEVSRADGPRGVGAAGGAAALHCSGERAVAGQEAPGLWPAGSLHRSVVE